jgi:hypothetical protein
MLSMAFLPQEPALAAHDMRGDPAGARTQLDVGSFFLAAIEGHVLGDLAVGGRRLDEGRKNGCLCKIAGKVAPG